MKSSDDNKKEEFVRYIRKTGSSLGINIPFEVIEVLGLKKNEILRVTLKKINNDGRIEFVRYIRKTGTSLGINIPFEVIKVLDLKENEIVRVMVEKAEKNES